MKKKYNFIVVCRRGDSEIYKYAYSQVQELEYVFWDEDFPNNKLLQLLNMIHWSSKINKYITLPGKEFWINLRLSYYKFKLEKFEHKDREICFLLFGDCLPLEEYGLSLKIREKFPNCKIIYFFQDIISAEPFKQKFIREQRHLVDYIYTFDKKDAEKYDLLQHNVPYSDIEKMFYGVEEQYDICFVGAAKNRLDDLIKVYEYLRENGLKCVFYIAGVSEEQRQYSDEIHYCSYIPYSDYLKVVLQSKCILEIIQKGSSGNTMRVNEARIFHKKLLSNNLFLEENKFFEESSMLIFDDIKCVDILSFLDKEYNRKLDNNMLYPAQLFKDIEDKLNEDFEKSI